MRAIQLVSYGNPLDGLVFAEIPAPPAPGKGEVLIDMEFAPVNPSDFLVALGVYTKKPELPSVIGGEGVGVVRQLGEGVDNVKVGDRVLISYSTFTWAQQIVARAEDVIVAPPDIDVQQAAMLNINPPTAALLLSEYVDLQPGDWVVQNAANSGVGRAVIAFAKARGLKTINIVRRQELVQELKKSGGDVVLLASETVVADAKNAAQGGKIRLGLDGVGGQATGILCDILSPGGHIVAYSAMSQKPMSIGSISLIFNKVTLDGFFMYFPEHLPKVQSAIVKAIGLLQSKKLNVPIAATYRLTEIKTAVEHALRGGKVLLDMRKISASK
jgi:NADPH:quinone reductase-like Zn-dependent oxidoreductase